MLKPGAIVIGLDLGPKRDPSALAILEVGEDVTGRRDPVTWEWEREPYVNLLYLERIALGTPYPDIVQQMHSTWTAHAKSLFGLSVAEWRDRVETFVFSN